MILSRISIKRPVLATVMTLTVILLGAIAFEKLSVREYPKIDPPVVSVRTVFKGATAEVIESVITTPIEDSLSGIEGIKTIKSQSKEEVSQVTVTFNTNRNIEDATNDVRDRVSRVKVLLPDPGRPPIPTNGTFRTSPLSKYCFAKSAATLLASGFSTGAKRYWM